jgi:phospholipid/cholesterol/gamma-HCH transport system substrate-binding protein
MANGSGYSNSVRAGAFLLTAVALGLVVVLVLMKTDIFTGKNTYKVGFKMDDGVAGLEVGAEVRVSGLKVGRVSEIEQDFNNGKITVTVEMRRDIVVREQAEVMRAQPLLGNYSWLNFTSLGTGNVIPDGGAIEATPSGGLLATIVGPQNATRANEIFGDLVAFTRRLDEFAREDYPVVKKALADAQFTVSDIRENYDGWRKNINEGLSEAAGAMRKLNGTMDDAQVAVKDAREVVRHFREVNLQQLDKTLAEAERGATSFASSMDALDAELVARIPDARAMMADLRQGAAQVKLATMEVRRSPWKLFYRPSGDELARENLYESARAFALASSDMRVAGETLSAVLRDQPERFASDERFRDALKGQVTDSMARYEAAQKALFDVLRADFPKEAPPEAPMSGDRQVTLPTAAPAPAAKAAPAH